MTAQNLRTIAVRKHRQAVRDANTYAFYGLRAKAATELERAAVARNVYQNAEAINAIR